MNWMLLGAFKVLHLALVFYLIFGSVLMYLMLAGAASPRDNTLFAVGMIFVFIYSLECIKTKHALAFLGCFIVVERVLQSYFSHYPNPVCALLLTSVIGFFLGGWLLRYA